MKLRFFTRILLGWVLFCNIYFVQDLVGEVYRENDKKSGVGDAKNLLEKFPDNLIHDVVDFQLDHVVFPFLHQKGLLDYKYDEVSQIITQRVRLFFKSKNLIELSQLYIKNPHDAVANINTEIRDDIKKSVENYFISHGRKRIDQFLLHSSYKHAHEVARVRISKSIPVQEAAYIKQRKENARIALSKLLKRDVTKVPTIAIVASGGGFRAMLATLGFLRGLEDIGLLDAVSYISTLSGSTWLLATWVMSNFTLDQLENKLIKSIEKGLVFPENSDSRDLAINVAQKYRHKQPITLIDFYGSLIIQTILSSVSRPQALRLSEHMPSFVRYPFSIYTAAEPIKGSYRLWEFSPLEVGPSEGKNASYVPTWAFGRKFNKNISQDFAPEQALATLLGTFGSAFEFNLTNVNTILNNLPLPGFVSKYILFPQVSEKFQKKVAKNEYINLRQDPARFHSFDSGKQITLIDAGMLSNLASYIPVKRRSVDIVIMLDMSTNASAGELHSLWNHLRVKARSNPDYSQAMSVITEKGQPKILYFPLIRTAQGEKSGLLDIDNCKRNSCNTLNMKYDINTSRKLINLARENIKERGSKKGVYKIIDELSRILEEKGMMQPAKKINQEIISEKVSKNTVRDLEKLKKKKFLVDRI